MVGEEMAGVRAGILLHDLVVQDGVDPGVPMCEYGGEEPRTSEPSRPRCTPPRPQASFPVCLNFGSPSNVSLRYGDHGKSPSISHGQYKRDDNKQPNSVYLIYQKGVQQTVKFG